MRSITLRKSNQVHLYAEVGVRFIDLRHDIWRDDLQEWQLMDKIHLSFSQLYALLGFVLTTKGERLEQKNEFRKAAKAKVEELRAEADKAARS